jgi:hypothetical protein
MEHIQGLQTFNAKFNGGSLPSAECDKQAAI